MVRNEVDTKRKQGTLITIEEGHRGSIPVSNPDQVIQNDTGIQPGSINKVLAVLDGLVNIVSLL